jgi:hypothetical protein
MSFFRRRAAVRLAMIALTIYAGLLAAGPVAHADLGDHVKASSHCQLCAGNPLAARVEPRVAVSTPVLAAAGDVASLVLAGFVAPVPFRTSGRSPPA